MAGNQPLLAACGGDTIKIFDVSMEPGDPCTINYSPSPGFQVNSVKWNHTNLVVASAGDDKKISLWRKNGESLGTLPLSSGDIGDNIDESILSISFSNKGSRYLCSGGSGQIVRIWDLQRKRCIKWLKGHADTITGVMYNYKDEHLASISLKGDLILHNLASGARAAELKDPNDQVLRVLDYSRISRHILVTAGDDGSLHLWDTTGRNPKVSWLKQHSAPTTGVCFSPSNDKIIASIGLDKKLYTFDSGTRRPTFCIPYEAPFSSLAFRDDGWRLAAGTNSGRIVFYDVRGKPQPLTVLRAYNSSEAVTSLCWQRSKPIIVNESSSTVETILLGGAVEDSILMPDPLPSLTSSSISSAPMAPGSRNLSRGASAVETSLLTTTSSGLTTSTSSYIHTAEETPQRNHLWKGAALARLHAPRTSSNFVDDMDVFSPLVDVQPITPSLGNWWGDQDEAKKDNTLVDKKSSSLSFASSSIKRFPFVEEANLDTHPISDWKFSSTSRQDDNQSNSSQPSTTPVASSKSEESFSATPPEAWGGDGLPEKFTRHRPLGATSSRFLPAGSFTSGPDSVGYLSNMNLNATNTKGKDFSSHDIPSGFSEPSRNINFSSISTSLGSKSLQAQANLEFSSSVPSILPRRFSSYAERISTNSSFSDGAILATSSPKVKKTGAETKEELVSSLFSKSDTLPTTGVGIPPSTANGVPLQSQRGLSQQDHEECLALIDALEKEAINKRRKIDQNQPKEENEEGLYTAALKGSNSLLWKNSSNSNIKGTQRNPTSKLADNFSYGGGTVTVTADRNNGTCFKCGQHGHWSRDCSAPLNRAGGCDQGIPEKPCRCGAGTCLVFTANTEKNPGRKFYRCPLKEENGGCGFFEWCDTPSTGSMSGVVMQRGVSNYASDPSVPDLQCPCGAGSCLVLTAKTEKNMGQQFYRCPAKQGDGSCGFFKWCTEYNPATGVMTRTPQVSRIRNDTNSSFSSGKSGSSCYKCGQEGHWSPDCPNPSGPISFDFAGRSTHYDSNSPSSCGKTGSSCYKCGRGGHWARDCPHPSLGSTPINVAGRSALSGTCYKCGKAGHWARDCEAEEPSSGFGSRKAQVSFRTSRG